MSSLARLLTIDDLCKLLGVMKKTVYGWTSRREIPFVKIGNRLRFEEAAVSKWVEDRRQAVFDPAEFVDDLAVHERAERGP
jgi:excisionase family DNA binding protein